MIRRLAPVLVLCVVLLGLAQLDDPHGAVEAAPSSVSALVERMGSAMAPEATSSTWFCPSGGSGVDGSPTHEVVIANAGEAITARVTGYRQGGGQSATTEVAVAASSEQVVIATEIAPDVSGVTVEAPGEGVTVAHRLVSPTSTDQSDCLTNASQTWHFAAASTELGETSQLWLLNPFPTDASIDVAIVTEEGVRTPKALRGLIVPAESSRMVDIGAAGQRRVQVAFSVTARGGRVVAELAQTTAGAGLRLQPGVASPMPTWVFADSFGGPEVSDRIVLYNPTPTDVTTAVSVVPVGVDPSALPEPFVIDVPARRYATVQLDQESRVPPDARRWIQVETVDAPRGVRQGIVALELVRLTGGGGDGTVETRPSVPGGLASTIGSPLASRLWTLSTTAASADGQSVAVVVNPSADTIALVTVATRGGGTESAATSEPIEVPPLAAVPIDLTAASAAPVSVTITSPNPVVVAGRTTSTSRVDLAMWPALLGSDQASVVPSRLSK